MKIQMWKATVVTALAAFVIVFGAPALAAEKIEQTSMKSNPRTVYRSAITVAEGHEIGTELILSEIKFSNPSFRVKEEWVYNQFNMVNGTGPHWGTFIDIHENGSRSFGKYEGNQKTVANPDGSWISTWEGKYHFLGGTGKYKNIKGNGTYKGRATSTGEYSEEGREAIEF